MSTKVFRNNLRKRGTTEIIQGPGSFTVDLDFQPNFLEAEFSAGQHTDGDTVEWTLTIPAPGTWQLGVQYQCAGHRRITYVASKLYVNPEQTISF